MRKGRKMTSNIISKEEAKRKIDTGEDILIIDARSEDIYTGGSDQIQRAMHLTETEAKEIFTDLPKNKEYLIYKTKGEEDLSIKFANFMKEKGLTAYAINGGYEDWRDSGFPIEPINAKGTPLL